MLEQRMVRKVLIANRGEIAVRLIRACRDANVASVAVYADQDRESMFVRLADEAYPLHGNTPLDSYLSIDKLIRVGTAAGADSVHPGYGFLAESAAFAAAVADAGLIWIGPPPQAIEALGDKIKARHIAKELGVPLVPGSADPIADAAGAVTFAEEHGLPIAIKAAFGGGGRGLRVARRMQEVADLFELAVREATAAFGRGECFVEKFIDRPRHVETQCLADQYGNVVVISTRDCTLQRRHQKLVEEAPAPFLTDEQIHALYLASKKLLRHVGYVGAGTCEFLVDEDGAIFFLEVNTRLQVEHTVSEEVSGLDLVGEMFRIAGGQELGYDDPPTRGHSIEFRINAEDAALGFLPAPGRLTTWRPPSGPGVRIDEGYQAGDIVPREFDSLIAKMIVTGSDRLDALARARRAFEEFEVGGMPTVIPFHRAVLADPAFVGPFPPARADGRESTFGVFTQWIETCFAGVIDPYSAPVHDTANIAASAAANMQEIAQDSRRPTMTIAGRVVDLVPVGLYRPKEESAPVRRPTNAAEARPPRKLAPAAGSASSGVRGVVRSPIQATVVRVAVSQGDAVAAGDTIVVIEAMKMEHPLKAPQAGTVHDLTAHPGVTVSAGMAICRISDD